MSSYLDKIIVTSRPRLTFAEIDAFDPHGPASRKWCPLCGQDKPRDAGHRCLSLDRESGLWKCFRCGAGGRVTEQTPENPSRQFARRRLNEVFSLPDLSLSIPVERPIDPNSAPAAKFDWRTVWENAPSIEKTSGERYLRGRCVSVEAMNWAGLRFCARWAGQASVLFPIRTRSGELLAAQGRAVKGSAKRTHGPKKEGAFFAPVVLGERIFAPLDKRIPSIILVEAPIDALSIASCGFPSLALCGTSGPSWLHLACGLRRVSLAFDADDAGERAARSIEAQISPFGARCERLCPQGFKDWNEWLQGDRVAMTGFLEANCL